MTPLQLNPGRNGEVIADRIDLAEKRAFRPSKVGQGRMSTVNPPTHIKDSCVRGSSYGPYARAFAGSLTQFGENPTFRPSAPNNGFPVADELNTICTWSNSAATGGPVRRNCSPRDGEEPYAGRRLTCIAGSG